ncbi:TlpA disulfide reductase family protein [Deferrisoma camini]|uniref:TlpA disulfide reductase family protein n=1 Tax=Deferrisoma camini TaxID=1035120 RepID=UPI00046CDB0C|nr:TlpA disulfide reductase family protein [Deferrisoma camini]
MRRVSWGVLALLFLMPMAAWAFKRTREGQEVKDFRLTTPAGETVHLREALGSKATVVVFWAMWSPRSEEALRDFQNLYERYADRGLQVIAVNVEHQERDPGEMEAIARWAAERGLTFSVVVDTDLSVFNRYGVIAVPSLLLCDAEGTIRALLEGYSDMTRDGFKDRVLELLGVLTKPEAAPAEAQPVYRPKGMAERYTRMGEILLKRRMAARAVKVFRQALEEDPDYPRARQGLARALEVLGKEQGRSAPEKVEARWPTPVRQPEKQEGPAPVATPEKREPEKTERSEAVEKPEKSENPEEPEAAKRTEEPAAGSNPRALRYVRMGKLLLARKFYPNAEAVFRRAVEADPACREAYLGLAEALEAQGKTEEAQQVRERAGSAPAAQPSPADAGAAPNPRGGTDEGGKPGGDRGDPGPDGGGPRGADADRDR